MIKGFAGKTPKIAGSALIADGAHIIGDVEIGSGCIIGAGCLVPQGMKVPDGSFVVGVPGKIKGPVSSQQSFWIKEAPQTYARLVVKYREGGGL
jgi:carbonic anhydrase/acetyltransferase-like protein (isoleucine patch superfamily)